ncbi:TetR family transcriptional regulator [Promicromonospora sukumoe]|uniref:TetR family transcriptional regulator n=1 Tax=Promicromonospora sukumoe TaxID=88382 RepID=UPI00364EACDC
MRARITEIALELFAERGFEQVTVEQIAAEAGMSARTFHRYFPAKEDVVIGDPARGGEFVRGVLAGRPQDEPVWDSLRLAFDALVTALTTWANADDDTTASELLDRSFATLRPQV